jgi:hypothetical protein
VDAVGRLILFVFYFSTRVLASTKVDINSLSLALTFKVDANGLSSASTFKVDTIGCLNLFLFFFNFSTRVLTSTKVDANGSSSAVGRLILFIIYYFIFPQEY